MRRTYVLVKGTGMSMFNQHPSYAQTFRAALLTNLLYMAVLPIVIYHVASSSLSMVDALLLAALPPALRTMFGLLKQGRLNLLGVLALVSIAVKLLSGLAFQDPRLVLVSASLVTGVHSVLLLSSLLFGQPLLQTLARNMLATTPSAGSEQLTRRWDEPQVRSFFTLLTALVGGGLLIECIVRCILVFRLSVSQFLVISPIVHYGLLGCVLLAVVLLVRHRRIQGRKPEDSAQPRHDEALRLVSDK
jgi:intracellular septation protein A